ncbi:MULTISPECIES: HAD family hydrolase [Pseudothermotoga]|jgi:putative hydrolase of the HAD superfamily|uniref:HAD-superfamily hydrolase, subfamily IA, variant 3 n=1 Tax=Pseudothermotoga lettingae (strain ATCC BAA-301 / DSM 14385 / NBRC 107922 / TMO) TaxID=416591 RepID=A8F6N5_PSELT|nr:MULTISPECIES: HAD family phosphatase [Pseudothermotoga]ABV33819.1 HAD-superfamily hydrolase, subfamily IA, variant 3 [Pseudothermotoga lettingae TMO]KUK21342.1 MAG: HAD-superfamily hydrolase, subfamily IA, variant 3 [Pseudothermotoga lettingae]MDI3495731.1 putative hydrolase of the superfamily [Pseudothermotoga sp.]MDK2884355.1 putative hydrolase of the superfamily [Pseudothermotoga sp.]GLI49245.1 haloacid dehalogenase [Pseudothermotoga lettingae TMO]
MLKNIVFDLGRVLVNWEPYEYMLKRFPKDVADRLNREIFEHKDWQLMDKGVISEDQLWQKKLEELAEYAQYVLHMKEKSPQLLTPIEQNVKLLDILKEKGFKLYVLSNFSENNFKMIYEKYDFFKLFDGMIISSYVKAVKPEREIYLKLINKYNLVPQESLFIDDKLENIQTAQEIGFKTIHLPHHWQLKEKLFELKIMQD